MHRGTASSAHACQDLCANANEHANEHANNNSNNYHNNHGGGGGGGNGNQDKDEDALGNCGAWTFTDVPGAGVCRLKALVRVVTGSTLAQPGSLRFRPLICTYDAPP